MADQGNATGMRTKEINPSSQAIDSLPPRVELPEPLSFGTWASVVGLFLGWPIVVYLWFPYLKNMDTIYYVPVVAGSLLWFVSCGATCGLCLGLFGKAKARWPRKTRAAMAGWFFGWPPLFMMGGRLVSSIEHPHWIDGWLIIPGAILWIASWYGIYDMLFTMAEARWPRAKEARKIVGSLLKALVFHHHHSSD